MSMEKWAENEIEIACKRERANAEEDDWDYGVACYKSALKAFKSLCGDGHSGMSIGITHSILNRLIDGKPLTPIEDTDDVWNDASYDGMPDDYAKRYQCKRLSSLFKIVHKDGRIAFNDVDAFRFYDTDSPNVPYSNGFFSRIMLEMFPLIMPYYPAVEPVAVFTEDFLTDRKNGDYDTKALLYCILPDGERKEINRYFKETADGFKEISKQEYAEREKLKIKTFDTSKE